jgi:type I restriction enzyme R subunit
MPVDHREIAFEAAIEDYLVNQVGEEERWLAGNPSDYDRAAGLDPKQLFAFIEDTQAKQWAKLVKLLGGSEAIARERFLKRVSSQIDSRGTLDVLRRGVKESGIEIKLAYFKPAHGITPELNERYRKNRLSLTRQLMYAEKGANDEGHELDLALFLNGIPVATSELKNELTQQTVEDAKRQYRDDRDPKELLFARRALVHFAVDPDLVFVTTRLAGKKTEFLPFNRGSESGGAGNPENPDGYKSSYLWEQVWQRDAWLDILARFVHVQTQEVTENGKRRNERTTIFPRFHQWDAVLKLAADARARGAGHNYLSEHSAGSGKSNTIGWTAHRLSTLYDEDDQKVFDQVIVITDRVVLDRQLQGTISQFEQTKGVVETIDDSKSSKDLAKALRSGTAQIIVTTLQKFPFVLEQLEGIKDRTYAIIPDEAHSSQTGEAAAALKSALGTGAKLDDDEEIDAEDAVAAAVAARGPQPNLSFFAFTATPKAKTLELFGTRGSDGHYHPFHLYSMRQAIEEGFILDVLTNYTTYQTFWRVGKKASEDPEVVKSEAASAIARFASLHPENLAQHVEVIVEHFRQKTAKKIGGKAKAMVVTSSRKHAVRYKQALDKYISEKGYGDVKALVAFSGKVSDDGVEYTEAQMNGFPESQLPEKFKGPEYGLLVVAEKYQTGFDQPLLHTMYVDKKLEGVKAVQTLSRLNRIHPGKDDTFVLDFRNSVETIQEAFEPYYEATFAEETDPNILTDSGDALLDHDVIREDDVDELAAVFFKPAHLHTKSDHAQLYAKLAPAKVRFKALQSDDEREEFRDALKRYVRLYSFLSQIVPHLEARSEKLFVYGRYLLTYLPREEGDGGLDLGEEELVLTHLRIIKTGEHNIGLMADEEPLFAIGGDGTGRDEDKPRGRLSEVIQTINERFGIDLTDADQLYFEQIGETLAQDKELQEQAAANELETFKYGFEQKFEAAVIDRQEANEELFRKLIDNEDFRDVVSDFLLKQVYERLVAEATALAAERPAS